MNNDESLMPAVEPERYELFSGQPYHFEVARRDFVKLLGAGIAIALVVDQSPAQESGGGRRGQRGGALPKEISAWIHVDEGGDVTVYTGKVEVGQDIRTSLTQVVADELQLPMAAIKLVMGDTSLTPYDMGTFGSMTTRVMSPQLRKAAAAAREALIDLAADEMKVDRGQLAVERGRVVHSASGRSLDFKALTQGKKMTGVIADTVATTPPARWLTAGKTALKVNGEAIVTGKHKYTSDIKRPGMLHGKVLRMPALNSSLTSVDTRAAESMPGVTVVRDGDFVGVAAPNTMTAEAAIEAIRAEWKQTPQPSARELFSHLKKRAAESGGSERGSRNQVGSVEEGLKQADKRFESSFTVSYIAHVPLEPRAAVAEWTDGALTVWTGTQRPFGVRAELAQAFRIPESSVRVIVPDTGSAYGGKHTGDAAIEAARLARSAGKPVKVVWTREEEFTGAYFRPAGVIEVKSGVTREGKITAWEYHNYNSGASAIRPLYEIPNQRIEFHPADSPLRQGSYRGLAATANHFAREMVVDEMARDLDMDPLELRLKNLKDERLRAVLEAAAKEFGWRKTAGSKGSGFGIAGGFEKGGYVASCAEVAIDSAGRVKVVRVVTAFECGAIVNPDHLKSQIEGSVIMGIGGALFEAIDFDNGKILNPRLSRYRVPRFSDAPALKTVLLDRKDIPSAGAGETPIVCVAPAIGNAIFDASGIRVRSLPMVPNGLKTEKAKL